MKMGNKTKYETLVELIEGCDKDVASSHQSHWYFAEKFLNTEKLLSESQAQENYCGFHYFQN